MPMVLNLCISEEALSLVLAKLGLEFEPKIPIEKRIRENLQFYKKLCLIH